MRYLSVCSGIEAATVAWHPLGWEPAAFAEIDAFPSATLRHHYPRVPNAGDFTTIEANDYGAIDLLVGGTPCQAFSVAGKRAGLDDPRGNLTIEFARLADRLRPRWLVWENVPGVLSIDGGRTFGAFLGMLGQLGYRCGYRILDAQFFGVPQRRRRVFLVGHLGDWRRAAAVLFERHSLSGHPPPRREAGQNAPTIPSRRTGGGGFGTDFDCDGGLIASTGDTSHCLNAGGMGRQDYETETLVAQTLTSGGKGIRGHLDPVNTTLVTHSLRADGFDASEDGTGRGTPLVHVEVMPTMRAAASQDGPGHAARSGDSKDEYVVPVAFQECVTGVREYADAGTLRSGGPGHDPVGTRLRLGMAVRRLTPRECERLQGFPDDYTLIPYRGKPAADGPRYKALGNSMAVPVMRWIGARIDAVEKVTA